MDREEVISALILYIRNNSKIILSAKDSRNMAEDYIAIIERQAVKNHYRAIASRTNAKKGFGSNKKLASEMGKRRWMDVKKQVK